MQRPWSLCGALVETMSYPKSTDPLEAVVKHFCSLIFQGVVLIAVIAPAGVSAELSPPPPPPRPGPNQPPMGANNPPVGNPQSQLNLANPGSPQQMMQRQNQQLQMQRMAQGQPGGASPGGLQQGVGPGALFGAPADQAAKQFGGTGGMKPPSQQTGFVGGMSTGFGRGATPSLTAPGIGGGVVSGNYLNTVSVNGSSFLKQSPLESLR